MSAMRTVSTRTGAVLPVLGQGTWKMGSEARRKEEVAAIRLGIDLGMTMIDTAEMYGSGGAEEMVGEAIAGKRDSIFLVTKVLPSNASKEGTILAAERSLKRLRTDRIDLYLLHWESQHPLADTLAAFEKLHADGKVLNYGVSNFDLDEVKHAEALTGGSRVAANQVLYNLKRRGIERTLMPWCVKKGIVIMAYSPLDEGALARDPVLEKIGKRHGATSARVAIAWTIRQQGVVSIPKSSKSEHVRENAAAAAFEFTKEDLAELDAAFPAPTTSIPLETA